MTTVNFGTSAHATAMTSFAPSRAMPPASYSLPTMKPVMFCRKTSGTRRSHASSMKCAPFCDALREEDAVVREDPDRVALDVRPAADERLAVERLELVEPRAVDDARDHLARIDLRAVVVGDQPVEIRRVDRGRLGRRRASQGGTGRAACAFATMRRAIASACSSEVA